MPQKIKLVKSKKNHAYQNRRIDRTRKKTKDLPGLQTQRPKLIKKTPAAKIWDKISPYLRKTDMIKNVDLTTILMLVTQIEIFQTAYKNVEKNGIQKPIFKTVQNAAGEAIGHDYVGDKKNPAVTTMDAAIRQIRGLCGDLGLTPASRAKLIELAANNTDDDDMSLKQMLTRGGEDF